MQAPGPATVLVVEDSTVNRMALVKGVQREGHQVLEAGDGRAALAVLADQTVDMVLLDLLMPEVDGFDVLASMAADPDLREVPVLVISAVEATEDIARAIELGAIDCLPKPFDPVLLNVRLRTGLEQARLRQVEQEYLRQELALRQQERLATLGRLSAGLGHELNNPAAAALSASRRLADWLPRADDVLARLVSRPDGADLVAAVERLVVGQPVVGQPVVGQPVVGQPGLTAAAAADRAIELEEVLARFSISEPWNHSGEMAAAGITPDALHEVLAGLGGDGASNGGSGSAADVAVAWFSTRAELVSVVGQIGESVGRIAELISALRGYSYLDRAPQQDVDLHKGLDDTVMILGHKIPDGVEIRRDYGADVPPISAFGGQLNQVWTNLLDNAIDAVGEQGRVTIRTRKDPEGVLVEVEDDGPGIPDDLAGRIFDPFVTTKPPGAGTGLGLNVSHQIITDVHGGRLSVRSRPGQTVFIALLPLLPPTKDTT